MAGESALNYPYIRIRDVEWLKRTLLLFPSVMRMTPFNNAPADAGDVFEFTQAPDAQTSPLLDAAKLWAPHVIDAQHRLIKDLKALFEGGWFGRNELLARFRSRDFNYGDRGEPTLSPTEWEKRFAPGGSFQIHSEKILPDLVEYLKCKRLAWEPRTEFSDGPLYLEMNPRLGEAVMATLAYACAENEGLQVVTEFPQMHGRLIGVPRDAIMEACFETSSVPGKTSGQQVGEFLVHRRCDVSELTAERLYALKSERDLLIDFRKQLEVVAKEKLPPLMHDQAKLQQCLDDEVTKILAAWQADKRNLSNYARRLFGEGVLEDPIKSVGKMIQDSMKTESAAGAAVAAASAQVAHAGATGTVLHAAAGAAVGFGIAFVVRTVKTWDETKKTAEASPYRYLTALEALGVSFSMTNVLNASPA